MMTRTQVKEYVREEILEGIDRRFYRLKSESDIKDFHMDEELAYERERNRVARFLGLPERRLFNTRPPKDYSDG